MALPPVDETVKDLVARAIEGVHRSRVEFDTYLVGVTFEDPSCTAEEIAAWKSSVKRAAGIALWYEWKERPTVDLVRPDLRLLYEVAKREVTLISSSIFVYGRYRKLSRAISQTQWHCRSCRGRGCRQCEKTGREHETSVEDLIATPLAFAFRARRDETLFHGAGREDLDVLTLGRGRPFVIELRQPRRRKVDLAQQATEIVEKAAGKIELATPLVFTKPDAVGKVKNLDVPKRYRALCVAGGALTREQVESIATRFKETELEQRTPERVSHRRVDKVRRRTVHEVRVRPIDATTFELELDAEGGTYIKEFVSSDEGRTTPSVAAHLGVPCKVTELDVLDVVVEDSAILEL